MSADSPASILFDGYGTQIATSQIVISTNNSSYAPLNANASFVGNTDLLMPYHDIDITVAGAPSSAPATLYFEFSPNSTHWDISVPLTLNGPTIIPLSLRVILPYFRVRYLNGSTPLTEFRLTTLYHREKARSLTRLVSQTIDANEPIQVMRSIINAQYPDNSFGYLHSNTAGSLFTLPNPSNNSSTTNVAVNISSTTLLNANSSRLGATIYNDTTSNLYLLLGTGTASTSNYTVLLVGGSYYEVPYNYDGAIKGIWDASASGAARCTELS